MASLHAGRIPFPLAPHVVEGEVDLQHVQLAVGLDCVYRVGE